MKNLVLLLLGAAALCAASPPAGDSCPSGELRAEAALLRKALRYQDNWDYLSHDEAGAEVIPSKSYLTKLVIRPIPVLHLNKALYRAHNDTNRIQQYYAKDSAMVMGFLVEGNRPRWLLKMRRNTPTSIGGESEHGAAFYQVYQDPSKCLYFDNTFMTLAYFSQHRVYLWNHQQRRFVDALRAIQQGTAYNHLKP